MDTPLKKQLNHMGDAEVPEPLTNFEAVKIKAMSLKELEKLLVQCNYHFDGSGLSSFSTLANINTFDFGILAYSDEPSEDAELLRLAAFRHATLRNDKLTLSYLLIDGSGCDKDVERSFALLEGLADDMRAPIMDRWRAHSNLSERYEKGDGRPRNSYKASLHAEIALHITKNILTRDDVGTSTVKSMTVRAKRLSSAIPPTMRIKVEIAVNRYFGF